jgi:hypothetical protein
MTCSSMRCHADGCALFGCAICYGYGRTESGECRFCDDDGHALCDRRSCAAVATVEDDGVRTCAACAATDEWPGEMTTPERPVSMRELVDGVSR